MVKGHHMNNKSVCIGLVSVCCLILALSVFADEEASNSVYVKTDIYGRIYAKCIPDESYGSKGITRIYAVDKEDDKLEATYPWYTGDIYLMNTASGISVVRIGPWARAPKPVRSNLPIACSMSG